jgi:hypothetical protein
LLFCQALGQKYALISSHYPALRKVESLLSANKSFLIWLFIADDPWQWTLLFWQKMDYFWENS